MKVWYDSFFLLIVFLVLNPQWVTLVLLELSLLDIIELLALLVLFSPSWVDARWWIVYLLMRGLGSLDVLSPKFKLSESIKFSFLSYSFKVLVKGFSFWHLGTLCVEPTRKILSFLHLLFRKIRFKVLLNRDGIFFIYQRNSWRNSRVIIWFIFIRIWVLISFLFYSYYFLFFFFLMLSLNLFIFSI